MDKVKYTIIKNWLMSKSGNDYWVCTKYYERANIQKRHWPVHMEVFLTDPFDATGKEITDNELLWLMRSSKHFNIHDMFAWYENGELHSANKAFPTLCNVDEVATFVLTHNDDLEDDELHEILNRI